MITERDAAITVVHRHTIFLAATAVPSKVAGWWMWRSEGREGWVNDNEEHITWIHGHHAPGSEAVQALVAAHALALAAA